MKKKTITLLLAISLIASMTIISFATINDNPKACQPVLKFEEVKIN